MAQTYVFIHGWGLNKAVWEPLIAMLPASTSTLCVNIPGFGGAPWHSQLADIEACAQRMADDIFAQVNTPIVLVGWSLGGLLATLIALRYPDRVERLHTVASSPCFVAQPEQHWPGIQAPVLTQFQQQLQNDFSATLKRFLAVQAMGSPTARADIAQLQKRVLASPAAHVEALSAGLDWLASVDLRDQLPLLEPAGVPLWRAYGRLDTLVPIAVTAQIESGRASVFARSAHAPFMNQPEDFIQWLVRPALELYPCARH